MKILILGANGQLGKELCQHLACLGEVKGCNRQEVDLTNFESIRSVIRSYQPDWIVNAAAYTAVDKAESEADLAFTVNAEAVGVIAQEAKQVDAWLIHYSTDYVFDGNQSTPYTENDIANPINTYGKSKLAGENKIIDSSCKHIIFRTSWMLSKHGDNFANKLKNSARRSNFLTVVCDQRGIPTTTNLVANITSAAIKNTTKESPWSVGTYHLVPKGDATWYDVALVLFEQWQKSDVCSSLKNVVVEPISTEAYPMAARRPKYSILSSQKLQKTLDFELPHWKTSLEEMLFENIKDI